MAQDAKAWGDLGLSGQMQAALRDELTYRVHQSEILALEQQAQMAEQGRDRIMLEHGEVKMMVHPYFYHYWGTKLGYECWNDDGFVKEFIRDNESVRVKNHSRKLMVGHRPGPTPAPAREEVRGVKFHKSYGVLGTTEKRIADSGLRRTEGKEKSGQDNRIETDRGLRMAEGAACAR